MAKTQIHDKATGITRLLYPVGLVLVPYFVFWTWLSFLPKGKLDIWRMGGKRNRSKRMRVSFICSLSTTISFFFLLYPVLQTMHGCFMYFTVRPNVLFLKHTYNMQACMYAHTHTHTRRHVCMHARTHTHAYLSLIQDKCHGWHPYNKRQANKRT